MDQQESEEQKWRDLLDRSFDALYSKFITLERERDELKARDEFATQLAGRLIHGPEEEPSYDGGLAVIDYGSHKSLVHFDELPDAAKWCARSGFTLVSWAYESELLQLFNGSYLDGSFVTKIQ